MKMVKTGCIMIAVVLLLGVLSGCQPNLPDPVGTVEDFFVGLTTYDYETLEGTLGTGMTIGDIKAAIDGEVNRAYLEPLYVKMTYEIGEMTVDRKMGTASAPVTVGYPDLAAVFTAAYEGVLAPLVETARTEGDQPDRDDVDARLIADVARRIEANDAPMKSTELTIELLYQEETGWGVLPSDALVEIITGGIGLVPAQ